MQDIITSIKLKTPTLLKSFKLEIVPNALLPSTWNQGDNFVTQKLSCACSNQQLQVLTCQNKQTKGFFRKKEVIEYLAPVNIHCTSCNTTSLLFNPNIHGWNGQLDEQTTETDLQVTQLYTDDLGEVMVNYSYQNAENYQDLLDDNIANPQDYFDTITIYFKSAKDTSIREIFSYECA